MQLRRIASLRSGSRRSSAARPSHDNAINARSESPQRSAIPRARSASVHASSGCPRCQTRSAHASNASEAAVNWPRRSNIAADLRSERSASACRPRLANTSASSIADTSDGRASRTRSAVANTGIEQSAKDCRQRPDTKTAGRPPLCAALRRTRQRARGRTTAFASVSHENGVHGSAPMTRPGSTSRTTRRGRWLTPSRTRLWANDSILARSLGGRRGGSPGGVRAARPSHVAIKALEARDGGRRQRKPPRETCKSCDESKQRAAASTYRHFDGKRRHARRRLVTQHLGDAGGDTRKLQTQAHATRMSARGTGVGMNFSFCRFRTERPWQYQTRSAARVSHDRRARKRGSFKELSDGRSLPLVGATSQRLYLSESGRRTPRNGIPCTTHRSRGTAPATDARASSASRTDQPTRAERHPPPWARRAARHWRQSRRRRRGRTRQRRSDRPAAASACRRQAAIAPPPLSASARLRCHPWMDAQFPVVAGSWRRAHRAGGSRSAQKLRIRIAMNAAIPHGW